MSKGSVLKGSVLKEACRRKRCQSKRCRSKRIPRLRKAGWLRIKKNAPVPLKAQTGWLVISRSLLIDAREALLIESFQSVRCASIYKEASQYYATTPSARILGNLDARSHPALERRGITPLVPADEYVNVKWPNSRRRPTSECRR